MNERIKQLAEQAGYTKDMFGIGHWDMPECKKFAELIVEKCAGIIESQDVDPSFKLRMSWAVKEYFGIEQ
jgi:hypothetical protein